MSIRGPLSHIDLSVSDPDRAIPFYAAFFDALGDRRWEIDAPGLTGERPRRAAWWVRGAAGYYAVFFADPDGVKLEVVFEPHTNP